MVLEDLLFVIEHTEDAELREQAARKATTLSIEQGFYEKLVALSEDKRLSDFIRTTAREGIDEAGRVALERIKKDRHSHQSSRIIACATVLGDEIRTDAGILYVEALFQDRHVENLLAIAKDLRYLETVRANACLRAIDDSYEHNHLNRLYTIAADLELPPILRIVAAERAIEKYTLNGGYEGLCRIIENTSIPEEAREAARGKIEHVARSDMKKYSRCGYYTPNIDGFIKMAKCTTLPQAIKVEAGRSAIVLSILEYCRRHINTIRNLRSLTDDNDVEECIRIEAARQVIKEYLRERSYTGLQSIAATSTLPDEIKKEAAVYIEDVVEEVVSNNIRRSIESGWYKSLLTIAKDQTFSETKRTEARDAVDNAARKSICAYRSSIGQRNNADSLKGLESIAKDIELKEEIRHESGEVLVKHYTDRLQYVVLKGITDDEMFIDSTRAYARSAIGDVCKEIGKKYEC